MGLVGLNPASLNIPVLVLATQTERERQQKRTLALRRFHLALADAATSPVDIVISPADSIMGGDGVSSFLKRAPYVLQQQLRTRHGVTGGWGYIATQASNNAHAATPSDWPVVNTGGSATTAAFGLKGRFMSAAATSVLTITGHTSVDFYYYRSGSGGSAGVFSWKVDAGSATNVTANTGTANWFQKVSISLPDTGSHTVTIAWVSGAVLLSGFMCFNGDETKGIRVWDGTRSGASTVDFWSTSTQAQDVLTNCFAAIQPDLVITEIGANDRSVITTAVFTTNLTNILTMINAQVTIDPSIVEMAVWELNAGAPLGTWQAYVDVLYAQSSASDQLCIFDAMQRFRPALVVGDSVGFLRNDEGSYPSHTSDQGAFVLATGLADFLAP